MSFFANIGKSIGSGFNDFVHGLEEFPKKLTGELGRVGEGAKEAGQKIVAAEKFVEKGLSKTLEFIDVIKGPIQEVAKVGEVVGAIMLTVAPFVPPPGNLMMASAGATIEAVTLGIDKGIDLLNNVEGRVRETQEVIKKTKEIVELGKEIVEKHADTIKSGDITKIDAVVKDTIDYVNKIKELQEDIEELGKPLNPIKKLSDLTVTELKDIARENDFALPTKLLKADLVKIITLRLKTKGIDLNDVPQLKIEKKVKVKPTLIDIITKTTPEDDKDNVDKMTVKQLRAFAKENNIALPSKALKAELLRLVKAGPQISEEGEEEQVEGQVEIDDGLEKMLNKDLKKIVKSLGVKSKSLRKADLVEAIRTERQKQKSLGGRM